MRDRKLDRLFDRYRRRGDVAALGAVFDAAAPELLRVAVGLVRSPGDADDLIQATFLTAIEKAEAYDGRRRLAPWLLGILVRHAHAARRAGSRAGGEAVDGDAVPSPDEDPTAAARTRELADELEQALGRVPARYRDVLVPFLHEGRAPADIAVATGRAPGTVRMQIHRGLEHLRRLLPASLALGGAALVNPDAGRGLAAVREVVLARASSRAAVLAGAGAAAGSLVATASPTGVGAGLGAALVKKTALALAAAAALAGGLVWIDRSTSATGTAPVSAEGPAAPESSTDDALAAEAAEPGERTAALDPAREPAVEPAEVAAAGAESTSWEAALAGLTGRVTLLDGTPVAGAGVTLLELPTEELERGSADAFGSTSSGLGFSHEAASARTDAEGRFALRGARPRAYHALRVAHEDAEPFLRVVDVALAPGESTDVGDLRLRRAAPVVGRVVDESGEPIAEARVRALRAEELEPVLHFAPFRPGMPIVGSQGPIEAVVTVPPGTAALVDELPVARADTDGSGAFTLARAPRGELSLVVDAAGFLPRAFPVKDVAGARDAGEIVLERGRRLRGTVVDGSGDPVVGAEVRAGVLRSFGWSDPETALLAGPATTDAEGGFELTGVVAAGEDAEVTFAVRRGDSFPWRLAKPADPTRVVLRVPTIVDASLQLVDAEGEPVTGAEVVVHDASIASALPYGALLEGGRSYGRAVEDEGGAWTIHDLAEGRYVVSARKPGLPVAERSLFARAGGRTVTLRFEAAAPLAVTVVDAGDAPVDGALVTLLKGPRTRVVLARGRTDARGEVVLEDAPADRGTRAHLRVRHPAYGTRDAALERDAESVRVVLEPGGDVALTITTAGEVPAAPILVEFDRPTDHAYPSDADKVFAVTDEEGVARAEGLAPGRWRYRIFRRYLNQDLVAVLLGDVRSGYMRTGYVDVVAGGTAEDAVDVGDRDLAPAFPEGTAVLEGVATEAGVPRVGELVQVWSGVHHRETETDESGRFRIAGLPAGEVRVQLLHEESNGFVTTRTIAATRTIELRAGERTTVEFVSQPATLEVEVVDASGRPAARATVSAVADGETRMNVNVTGWTDARGHATLELQDGAPVLVRASSGDGLATVRTEVPPGGSGSVALRLDPGVPCGGEVVGPEGMELHDWMSPFVHVVSVESGTWSSTKLEFEDLRARFSVVGLPAGRCTAQLFGTSQFFEAIEFELPADGATDLELVFEAQE